jgi:hypothetical protein
MDDPPPKDWAAVLQRLLPLSCPEGDMVEVHTPDGRRKIT